MPLVQGRSLAKEADNTGQGDHSRPQETSPTDQVHESLGHHDCQLTHLSSLPVPVSHPLGLAHLLQEALSGYSGPKGPCLL